MTHKSYYNKKKSTLTPLLFFLAIIWEVVDGDPALMSTLLSCLLKREKRIATVSFPPVLYQSQEWKDWITKCHLKRTPSFAVKETKTHPAQIFSLPTSMVSSISLSEELSSQGRFIITGERERGRETQFSGLLFRSWRFSSSHPGSQSAVWCAFPRYKLYQCCNVSLSALCPTARKQPWLTARRSGFEGDAFLIGATRRRPPSLRQTRGSGKAWESSLSTSLKRDRLLEELLETFF